MASIDGVIVPEASVHSHSLWALLSGTSVMGVNSGLGFLCIVFGPGVAHGLIMVFFFFRSSWQTSLWFQVRDSGAIAASAALGRPDLAPQMAAQIPLVSDPSRSITPWISILPFLLPLARGNAVATT